VARVDREKTQQNTTHTKEDIWRDRSQQDNSKDVSKITSN